MRQIGLIRLIRQITKERFFSALVYLTVFLFALYPYRDYDWGWHFRYGEYFVKTGQILREDLFTWTMAGFPWINHSWLYDPIQYLLFTNSSFLGLSLAGAFVSFLAFYIGTAPYKISYWQKGILAIFFTVLTSGVVWQGLRSQVLAFLPLAVFMFLIVKIHLFFHPRGEESPHLGGVAYKYYIFVFPLLFLLWVNLHGSFTLGLLIFGIFLGFQYFFLFFHPRGEKNLHLGGVGSKRLFIPKPLIWLTLSFLVSFAATFINPFTYNVYLEAIRHARNPLLPYISEWIPVQFPGSFYNIFIIYSLLLLVGFAKRRKLADIPLIITSVIVFYLAFGARRYDATYVVATLPFAAIILKDFKFKLENYRTTAFIFIIAVAVSLEIAFFRRIPQYQIFSQSIETYCNHGSNCSEGLTGYLKDNPPQGRGFNFYDWGGYLIGRGVPAKLFIDGRMHLWQRGNYEVFLEYQQMYYEEDWAKFNQYNFDWVIAQPNSKVAAKIKTGELGQWETKYEDERAVYFVRQR